MTRTKKIALEEEHFVPRFSLLFATCCTNLSVKEATDKMNRTSPTGISSKWKLADKSELPEGFEGDNPWDCNDNPKYKHMYFVC